MTKLMGSRKRTGKLGAGKGSLVQDLVRRVDSGDRAALSRLLSCVENRDKTLPEIIRLIYPKTGRAKVIGITGPPGAGKSTLVDKLTAHYRAQGEKVAVIAVDPSSPFSGGAVLGDRIRMQQHATDDGVFIRSLGTRGMQGGLSMATQEFVQCFDAAGYERVIIETAGVGQTELGILKIAPTIVVVLVPESGDSIQVMKAGLSEIADIFVVNKSDRPEADLLVKDLVVDIGLKSDPHGAPGLGKAWSTPVLKTVAVDSKGIAEVVQAIESHRAFGTSMPRRVESARQQVQDILSETLTQKLEVVLRSVTGKKIISQIINKKLDPYSGAKKLKL